MYINTIKVFDELMANICRQKTSSDYSCHSNVKTDVYYVEKILKDLRFIRTNTQNLTLKDLELNEILCDSILFRLIQISENSSKLSPLFKLDHQDISWSAIKGMRNRIVHDYGEVKLDIVYQTVKEDIPFLCEQLEKLV